MFLERGRCWRLIYRNIPVKRNVGKVGAIQLSAVRFTCCDFKRTSSVTAMLWKLQRDSLQQRHAGSRVLMLYRIRNGLMAIPVSAYLRPATAHTRWSETRYRSIWNGPKPSGWPSQNFMKIQQSVAEHVCRQCAKFQFNILNTFWVMSVIGATPVIFSSRICASLCP